MYFDERAAVFAGKPDCFFFHCTPDPLASDAIVDREIADAGKVAAKRELGDEMKR